jgi:hypothetical protein
MMRKLSRSSVMIFAASGIAACISTGLAASVAQVRHVLANNSNRILAQNAPTAEQQAKTSEPYPINDDVDDPEIWGKIFPLQYELYLKTVDMHSSARTGVAIIAPTAPRAARLETCLR